MINLVAMKLRDRTTTYIQKPHLHSWRFDAAKEIWKVIVAGTIHDMMTHLKHYEVGGGKLRQTNNRQNRIYELPQGQATTFECRTIYIQSQGHTTMSYCSARKPPCVNIMMSDEQFKNSLWFQEFPKYYQDTISKAQNPAADNHAADHRAPQISPDAEDQEGSLESRPSNKVASSTCNLENS